MDSFHSIPATDIHDCRHAGGSGRTRRVANGRDSVARLLYAPYAPHQQPRQEDACMRDNGRHDCDMHRQDRHPDAESHAGGRHHFLRTWRKEIRHRRPQPYQGGYRRKLYRTSRHVRASDTKSAWQSHRRSPAAVAQQGRHRFHTNKGKHARHRGNSLLDRAQIHGYTCGKSLGRAHAARKGSSGDCL